METIRKITRIKNGSIYLKELEKLNDQEVEVIIFPLFDGDAKKTEEQKKRFFKYEGAIESKFTDTSTNIDKLVYGA